jgi:phospholipid transport system substrate-binding protein
VSLNVALRVRLVPLAACLAMAPSLHASPPVPPEQVMDSMDGTVLEALRTRRLVLDHDPNALYALVQDRIRPHFDLGYSARLIAGSAWLGATPAERAGFVAAFEHYLVSSYARALLFVDQDSLTVLGSPLPVDATRVFLPVRIVMDDGARIETEVHFRLEGDAWRIWDVRASGLSFVRQYRGDFGTEARIKGLAACARSLEEIAQRNEAELRDRLRKAGSIRNAR